MLSLYPFAPSIIDDSLFHSPFDLMEDDFGWPTLTRRHYVLPRRRYVHRHSPYGIDTLIDQMAGLTSVLADDDESRANNEKTRNRRSRSRSNSPRLSPRRASTNETENKSSEEKSDVTMAATDTATDKTTAAEVATPPSSSSPSPQAPTDTTATPKSPITETAGNTAVANTNNNTAAASTVDDKTPAVSPFRILKQLNGLQLTMTTSESAYTVTTPVPSTLTKNDLQLSVDNHVLTLSAQMNSSQANTNGKTQSSSRVLISRSIRLNRDANTDAINAHFSDGQLTITIPRVASEKPQTINIE